MTRASFFAATRAWACGGRVAASVYTVLMKDDDRLMPEPRMQLAASGWFILNFIACPNCNARLEPRPVAGEWNNVVCGTCNFACRFITAPNRPTDVLLGIRRAELEDLLQLKTTLPPLMLHLQWEVEGTACASVIFYPFIAYRFLMEDQSHPIAITQHGMDAAAVFSNLFELPSMILYESPSSKELAELVMGWTEPVTCHAINERLHVGLDRAQRIQAQWRLLCRKRGLGGEYNA